MLHGNIVQTIYLCSENIEKLWKKYEIKENWWYGLLLSHK